MDIRKGQIKNVFAKAKETPMATIMFLYSGTCKYDLRNNVLLSFLDQALDLVYTAEILEKEGGTYGFIVAKSTFPTRKKVKSLASL